MTSDGEPTRPEPMPWSTPEPTLRGSAPESPGAQPLAAPPPARRPRNGLIAGVIALALLVGGGITAAVKSGPSAQPVAAVVPSPSVTATATGPVDPRDAAKATLHDMAAALLRNDEPGWLAGVDPGKPAMRTFFQHRFESLRALDISQFSYEPSLPPVITTDVTEFQYNIYSAYCFSMAACPKFGFEYEKAAPNIAESYTFSLVGDRWLISGVGAAKRHDQSQPVPWEAGDLVFAQGRRVTVAAAPSVAKRLSEVVPLADRAAAVADRYGAMIGDPQRRYRVYLADDKQWKRWYRGEDDRWAIGYTIGLNTTESDVVLKMSALRNKTSLLGTIQHEMGHVVTLGGTEQGGPYASDGEMWLEEGIAEYIGESPRTARNSLRIGSVRLLEASRKHPTTIDLDPLSDTSSARASDAFYGVSHFAMDCMARKYGETKLFEFVKQVLREDKTHDEASRAAFGRSFDAVDSGCVTWIRQQV